MHEFRVPPAHAWYTTPTCSPDHGLLYICGNHTCVGYIPSPQNATGRTQMVDLRFRCKALVSDTAWDQTRWFITLNEDNAVSVWDLNTETIVRGHRAHVGSGVGAQIDDGVMCITSDRMVLTIAGDRFSSFCLRSNTYSLFRDDFISKRQRVTALNASPYADHIVAVGYKKGLIVIANIKDTTIIHTLRGHDSDILCMQWMGVDSSKIQMDQVIRRKETPGSETASLASSQQSLPQLGISSDATNEEAGVNGGDVETKSEAITEGAGLDHNGVVNGSDTGQTDSVDGQTTSTGDPNITSTEAISDTEGVTADPTDPNDNILKYYLATGAQESVIYIWDTESGKIMHKLNLKSHGKSTIPKPISMLVWISSTELIINNPNGTVCQWQIKMDANLKEKCVAQNKNFNEKGIIGICSSADSTNETIYVWTLSIFSQINSRLCKDGSDEIIGKYSTLPIGMYSIRECPHDSNKLAIAGNNKKIGVLDTLTMTKTNVDIQWLSSKIQSKVLALAWHPQKENVLSYSTVEGRIGTFDLSKPSNPIVLDKFCGKQVYRVDYGVTEDKCSLYACNQNSIAVFPDTAMQNKEGKYDVKPFDFAVTSLSTCGDYLAIGTGDGIFKLMTFDFTVLFEKKLSPKYISDIAWHSKTKRHVAVSSTDGSIHLFEFIREENEELCTKEPGVLRGHTLGVTWVEWSNKSENRLVSTGFDNSVRVWDTETAECLALCEYNDKMYCAVFMPDDENLVAASGKSETMHVFDVRERKYDAGAANGEKKSKRPKAEAAWAVEIQNGEEINRQKESKNKKKKQKKVQLATPVEQTNNMSQQPSEKRKAQTSSIFHLSSREINRDAIECLLTLLKDDGDDKKSYLITDFATKDGVKNVIAKELENTRVCSSDDVGNIFLPQLNNDLKSEILAKVEAKLLTAAHVSLAPSISFEFWRKCCSAYAFQNIEQGFVLEAMPYLLAIHQTAEAIEILCEKNFYREAWAVAKMRKDPDDKQIFDVIAEKWINYLVFHGNLEGGAVTALTLEKPGRALDILEKRKTTTPEIDEVIQLLKDRVGSEAKEPDA